MQLQNVSYYQTAVKAVLAEPRSVLAGLRRSTQALEGGTRRRHVASVPVDSFPCYRDAGPCTDVCNCTTTKNPNAIPHRQNLT